MAQPNVPGAPKLLSYQGVLTEPDLVKVPDGNYTLTFRIYDVGAGGTPLWEETQVVTTLDGVFDAYLGLITPLDNLSFDEQYWIGVEMQGESEMTPRTMLVAAPYAMYASRSAVTDSIGPDTRGVVTSLNTLQGDLFLEGENGVTIRQSGDTLFISATGGPAAPDSLSEGAIWYGDPNDDPTELPIGSPDQVLTVNQPGRAPEWSSSLNLESINVDDLTVNNNATMNGPVTFNSTTTFNAPLDINVELVVDSLRVPVRAIFDGPIYVNDSATFTGDVVFDQLPQFPLSHNAILVGNAQNIAVELPSSNTPGSVLQQDGTGSPTWQPINFPNPRIASGRVPTEGVLQQTINEAAVTTGAKIMIEYEDPNAGALIPVQVITKIDGASFTVQFSALPPPGTFISYIILP